MYFRIISTCFILFLSCQKFLAQGTVPIIENFNPGSMTAVDYSTAPQNWAVIQDKSGLIYVANTNGVLTWDGLIWRLVPGTRNELFFKFAADQQGRIFTGGDGELGYFGVDSSSGKTVFLSLLDKVPQANRDFSRIYNVISDNSGAVWFLSSGTLFRWRDGSFTILESDSGFLKVLCRGQDVIIQEKGKGLGVYDAVKHQINKVPYDFPDDFRLKGACSLSGSRQRNVWVTHAHGTFEYDDLQMKHVPGALDSILVWNVQQMSSSEIALGTQNSGLVYLYGDSIQFIAKKAGLQSEGVLFPYSDREGNTWCGNSRGVSRVELRCPVKKVAGEDQISGLVYGVQRLGNVIYIGTNEGLYEGQLTKNNEVIFHKSPDIRKEVFQLLSYQNLPFMVGDAGVRSVGHKKNQLQLSTSSSLFAYPSQNIANAIWLGTPAGLSSIWWTEGRIAENKFQGIDHMVSYIAEDRDGRVWASLFDLSMVDFSEGYRPDAPVTRFDSASGYEDDLGEIMLATIDGEVLMGTEKGLYSYDEASGRIRPDKRYGKRFADGSHPVYFLFERVPGEVWIGDGANIGPVRKDGQGNPQWDSLALARLRGVDIWYADADEEGKVWVGGDGELYRYDPDKPVLDDVEYHARVSSAALGDSVFFYGNFADEEGYLTLEQPENRIPVFDFGSGDLAFEFTALYYTAPEQLRFSFMLEGLDTEWSPWTDRRRKEYSNLPEGDYTFKVKALNYHLRESSVASYSFRIFAPWYRSTWAYVFWTLCLLALLYGGFRWYGRRIMKREQKLREAELARERALLAATVDAQEKERKRIAGDLHDEIQAGLAAVKMQLGILGRKMKKQGLEGDMLEEPVERIGESIQSVRRISHDLLPATLEKSGLSGALKDLCGRLEIPGKVSVKYSGPESLSEVPSTIALAIFRVIQEQFANSLKYAECDRIDLSLEHESGLLKVEYKDNGKGFDLEEARQRGGHGLMNIESRMRLVGGSFELLSEPGKGTILKLEVPL